MERVERDRATRCPSRIAEARFPAACWEDWKKAWGQSSLRTPHETNSEGDGRQAAKARAELQAERIGDNGHRAILRLQGLNALGDVAIVNVGAIDVHEMLDGGWLVAGGFIGRGQLVVEGNAGFAINRGYAESLLVPADGSLGHALFQEALRQPGVGLHDLGERLSAIEGLAGLLQL